MTDIARESDIANAPKIFEKAPDLDLLKLVGKEALTATLPESTADKLVRTAGLLSSGITGGALHRVDELLFEDKSKLALEFAAPAILAYGLTALQESGGKYATAAKVATYVIAAGMIADAGNRVVHASSALSDNWSSPQNYESNKDLVAKTLGAAVTDYSLMTIGAMAGVGARRVQTEAVDLIRDWGKTPSQYTPVYIEPGSLFSTPFTPVRNFFNHYRYGLNKANTAGTGELGAGSLGTDTGVRLSERSIADLTRQRGAFETDAFYSNAFFDGKTMKFSLGGQNLKADLFSHEGLHMESRTANTSFMILPTSFLELNRKK